MRASTAITWFGGKLDKTIVGSRDESMCVMLSTVALALLQSVVIRTVLIM